jgi:uncharacterized protein GlcG (DUF336 family)
MRRLNLAVARELILACEAKAATLGLSVVTAVVDEGGNLIALARMDGTQIASVTIAPAKAYTALAWRRPSADVGAVASPGKGGYGINTVDARFVLAGGGVPILIKDTIVGAIGVSGGTSAQDIACASAALALLGHS